VSTWLCTEASKRKQAELDELVVPSDLPIEMIAEEVKESWRLKEVHVEKLMQKVRYFPGHCDN
jgi:hypothetical protein